MPRATWPPANTAEVFTVNDPYVRPEDRIEQQEEPLVEEEEPEPEEE
jgi:hypothetical protein